MLRKLFSCKKKSYFLTLYISVLCVLLTACGLRSDDTINVITREDGSGTRGAFVDLVGLVEKSEGQRKDLTSLDAIVANKTGVVMINVANDPKSIGYISIGSINDTVKPLAIDGVDATADNIKNGDYKLSRPFLIVTKGDYTKGELSPLATDFIAFMLSKEGQNVVSEDYISITDSAKPFIGTKPMGKLVIAGSSSVTPVMEKLREEYLAQNNNAEIEIQMSDSTSGITAAIDGTCEIGMSSRSLKDSEKEKLNYIEIAIDGIIIVVNKENETDNITRDELKDIFMGKLTQWSELSK